MANTNDFLVKLLAQLDTSSINPEYEKLKKRLTNDPIIQKVTLDTSMSKQAIKTMATEIHNELGKAFKATGIEDFDITVKEVESILSAAVKESNKLAKELEVASSKAQKFLAQFNNKSGGTLVNSKEFKAVQDAINGLGKTSSIGDLNKAMNTLETTYNNMVSNLRNGGKSLNPFINAINDMKNMDSTLKGIELDFQSLSSKPKAVSDAIKELYTQQAKVNQYSQGTVEWSREYGILQGKIVAVKNEIQNVAKAEKASNTDESNKVKYYQKIIDNNKTIYSLKNKLLSADVKQTEEIEKQIVKLEKRNQYNYSQLNKKGLTDNSWERSVNSSKDALESQLRINSAKQEDIANTKVLVQAEKERAASLKEQEALTNRFNKIQLSTDVTKLTTDYQKFGVVSQQVENNLKELRLAQEAVINAKGTDRLATEIERYNTKLAETKSSLKELTTTQVSLNQRTSQMKSMQEWMRKNKNATELVGDQVKQLIEECNTCDAVRFNGIKREFDDLVVQAGKAGKLGNSFLGSLKEQASKFTQWVSISSLILGVGHSIKQIGTNVNELDDALTNISYTMDVSQSQLENIGNSSLQMAKDLHSSAKDVLDAVKLYANAKESADSILAKAQPAIMMSNVTGFSGETSAKYLQTIMNQFDYTQDDLMTISDTIQTVSQNIAHDFADGIVQINDAISDSGEVARAAGMDLAEYSSIIGVLVENTGLQGSQLGNAMKSIITRTTKAGKILGIDEGDISKAETALRDIGMEVRKSDGEFKEFDDTMAELASRWDELSQVEQSEISFQLAGTRQTSILKSLLKNWDQVVAITEKANNSSGTTLENQNTYAESLTGKLTELSAIWEKIGDDAVSSSWLKGLTDVGIGVSSLIEKFGLLKTAIVGIGAYAGIQNAGKCA